MATVVMFMGPNKERDEQFRKKVNEITKLMLDDGYTCAEYNCNTEKGYNAVLDSNKDCQLVFTTENNPEAQYQACARGIPVMEWRCFTDNKVSLIKVEKDTELGVNAYTTKQVR